MNHSGEGACQTEVDKSVALAYSNLLLANVVDWYKNADFKAQIILTLVECPSHNVIISDPSDNHGTETRSAVTDRRSTSRIEVVGRVTDAAGRRCIPGAADFGLGRGSEQQPDYELAFHDGTHDFTLEAAV